MDLKLYTSVANVLKLNVTEFRRLVPTHVEVIGKKTGRRDLFGPPLILNRVKLMY